MKLLLCKYGEMTVFTRSRALTLDSIMVQSCPLLALAVISGYIHLAVSKFDQDLREMWMLDSDKMNCEPWTIDIQ